jgi:hypothetical protein
MHSAALKIAIENAPAPQVSVRLLPKRQTPRALLKVVMAEHDNETAHARNVVLDALTDNRAAFWIVAGSAGHAIGNCVQITACNKGSLALALEDEITRSYRMNFPKGVEQVLDMLIPLNSQAVVQLMDAYAEEKTFRGRDELLARQFRVEVAA